MFLSLKGHRLVSRFPGYQLARDIALNFRSKSVEWNKAAAAPVY